MCLMIICERSILRLLYSNASTTIYVVSLSHFYLLETFFDVHNLTVLVYFYLTQAFTNKFIEKGVPMKNK